MKPLLTILPALIVLVLLAAACGTTRRKQPDTSSSNPSAERGSVLYRGNCQSCHGGATGGGMMDIPPPHNANGHTWHHPDCQLKDIVLNGSGQMGEMMRQMMGTSKDVPRMPAFKGQLNAEDIGAILTYIKTWWTPQQRDWQARVTKENC